MPYVLGIDLGAARTHAALRRRQGDRWDDPEPLWLGETSPATATALFLDDEGYLLTGDAATQAGAAVPSRLITGFHRRIGDDVPVFIGSEPFTPESLTTVFIEGIADVAASQTGEPPRQLVVTHPGDWGGYRRELLRQSLTESGFTAVTLVPSAVAALYAHLPEPGAGDRTAAVCEFGPDGVTVTLATASGASGWIARNSTEGVAPGSAVKTAFGLAQAANVAPESLAGIVFCGEPGPGTRPGRLPCPFFTGPQPADTAAIGAGILASQRTRPLARREAPAPETTLLPRVDREPELPERPERPPVEITPFTLPEPEGAAKLLRRWRPLAAAAAVLAISSSILIAVLTSHEATADKEPVSPRPPVLSSCAHPATAPSGEGHC
ncbi:MULTISPECIES: molecular chaperone DnaK [unclassified Amycolatopsis]|uniref:molecular chaperone DnaK n=1 Tax=unclassified Amycolatopsis TaxID=2618356 RepID=UPI00055CFE15|nr:MULTISPECIES: molecular chaperone DnaK [unclassified Amycolatopsis]MCG3757097.1 molecular chaperone DnaK [Amycolatopsis sp. Poz14]